MADVKWIKLSTGVFDNRKIKVIEKMPDGDALIVIWFKLLVLAGNINEGGAVRFTEEIPYTEQLLSTEFDKPLPTIQLAIQTFLRFGMIEIIDEVIHVSNWEKYQNVDGMERIREGNRIRQKNWYERQKALQLAQPNVRSNVRITQPNATDKDIDKEEDIDKERRIDDINTVAGDPLIMYAADNLVGMNADLADELASYRGQMTDDMIRWAINHTLEHGARNFAYVRTVLNGMVDKGYKTLAEVKAAEERRTRAKATPPMNKMDDRPLTGNPFADIEDD